MNISSTGILSQIKTETKTGNSLNSLFQSLYAKHNDSNEDDYSVCAPIKSYQPLNLFSYTTEIAQPENNIGLIDSCQQFGYYQIIGLGLDIQQGVYPLNVNAKFYSTFSNFPDEKPDFKLPWFELILGNGIKYTFTPNNRYFFRSIFHFSFKNNLNDNSDESSLT